MFRKEVTSFQCLLLSVFLLLSACGGSSGSDATNNPTTQTTSTASGNATPAAQVDNTCGIANFQSDMLARVNAYRAAGAVCGGVSYPAVGAVAWDAQLQQAATVHATDMAQNNFFSHTGSDGSTLRQRVPAAGYNYSTAGENIAAGQTSVQDVVDGWMNSPSHCANTMKAEFRDVGVSCMSSAASTYGVYWTLELGLRL